MPVDVNALRHWRFRLGRRFDDLLGGLLFLPGLLVLASGLLAGGLLALDSSAALEHPLESAVRAIGLAPDAVRTILVAMGSSMTTAVATLFSILLVVQTLASTQFTPRVLRSLLDDRTSQITMGVLLGNVVFSFLVLLTVRDAPPFIPVLSVSFAALLFLVSLGMLVNFIHHISQIIQINHLVDLVAERTEAAIDWAFPVALDPGEAPVTPARPRAPTGAAIVEAHRSGYVQTIDARWLEQVARAHGVRLSVLLPIGGFATRSVALLAVEPPDRLTRELSDRCLDGFAIAPVRAIRQDPDFGVRLLVDVALRAISPAVNDPSTAYTCVQHLGRLLVRAISRHDPRLPGDASAAGVVLPAPSFTRMLDHAVTQLRQYSRADFAVTLALLDVLRDLALETRHAPYLDLLAEHAAAIRDTRDAGAIADGDRVRIDRAWQTVAETVARQRSA